MKTATAVKTKLTKTENRVPVYVMPFVKALILLADAGLATACFMLAFVWREGDAIFSRTAWLWSKEFEPYAGVLLFVVPIRLVMLSLSKGLSSCRARFLTSSNLSKSSKPSRSVRFLIVAFTFMFRGGFAFREFSYSRGVFALDFAVALVAFSTFHFALRFLQTQFRKRDINLIPTLIVGTNAEAEQTIRELQERTDLGYRVVGIIENELRITNYEFQNSLVNKDAIANRKSQIANPSVPIVGTLNNLAEIIRDLAIQEVIITDDSVPSEKLFEAMMSIGRKQKVEFRLAPSLFNFLPQKTSVEQIGVLPMVRLFREPLSDAEKFIKRAFDILISATAFVTLAPVWILIALGIKFDSRGAVLFKQERVGMDGRKFLCYKFRTMKADADEEIHREAYRKNIVGSTEANAGDVANPVFGKVKNDPRVTKFGKFLRRTSLDELPQF